MEFGRIRGREISGKFRGTQWNSVGLCMALSMNSVGIPGGFRCNAGSSGKFGVWGGFGRFGGLKGFCANSHGKHPLFHPPLKACCCRTSPSFTSMLMKPLVFNSLALFREKKNVYQYQSPLVLKRPCNGEKNGQCE